MILSDLELKHWLKSYQQITKPAEGAEGPLWPAPGAISEVVPGPYNDWHYTALPILRLIEHALKQEEEIGKLKLRVRTLEQMLVEGGDD